MAIYEGYLNNDLQVEKNLVDFQPAVVNKYKKAGVIQEKYELEK